MVLLPRLLSNHICFIYHLEYFVYQLEDVCLLLFTRCLARVLLLLLYRMSFGVSILLLLTHLLFNVSIFVIHTVFNIKCEYVSDFHLTIVTLLTILKHRWFCGHGCQYQLHTRDWLTKARLVQSNRTTHIVL